MAWAASIIVLIGAGLPLGAWLLMRRLAHRPPGDLSSGDRVDDWLRREYGLAWLERSRVRTAVAEGRLVDDPALEGAAHGLAARTLSGSLRGGQLQRVAGRINLVIGAVLVAVGAARLAARTSQEAASFLIIEGVILTANGWVSFIWLPKRQRRAAARALGLNRAAIGKP
jgi:hypothetical protein